ncbi:hypothetical protein [Armatimonas rosea]|uniref:Uncharacterized protein n=1 Tax=Armatimonas rosea TaxID=685828 RepID=A0A7W9W7L9_ARMRO|nr:hypothetical protein [Armatimonas rosea]MBB6051813.1 hypothetical protein [Armatimonas rosea]
MPRRALAGLLSLGSLLVTSLPVRGDVTLRGTITPEAKPRLTFTLYQSGSLARLDRSDGLSLLFDEKRRELTHLDPANRTYSTQSWSKLEDISSRMGELPANVPAQIRLQTTIFARLQREKRENSTTEPIKTTLEGVLRLEPQLPGGGGFPGGGMKVPQLLASGTITLSPSRSTTETALFAPLVYLALGELGMPFLRSLVSQVDRARAGYPLKTDIQLAFQGSNLPQGDFPPPTRLSLEVTAREDAAVEATRFTIPSDWIKVPMPLKPFKEEIGHQ